MGFLSFFGFGRKKVTNVDIHVTGKKVIINNRAVSFPIPVKKLTKILGKYSRVIKKDGFVNDIYIWDELGIFMYAPKGSTDIKDISLNIQKNRNEKADYIPNNRFKGTLKIGDNFLNEIEIAPDTRYYEKWQVGKNMVNIGIDRNLDPIIELCSIFAAS